MQSLISVLVAVVVAFVKAGDEFPLLEKSNLVKTISTLSKSWRLTVDIRPRHTKSGWSNIVHATIGGDVYQYGDRVPGIWFHSDTSKLHICSAVNGNTNYIYDHPTALPMDEFTKVKVLQTKVGDEYFYRIYVGGDLVHQVVNTKPSVFKNVKLYAADPWYNPAEANIDQLEFENEAVLLNKVSLVKEVETLSRSWTLSVDIQPLGTKTGWSNVVHATIGQDIQQYGDRVPGIWFHSDTSKLHICSAVSGHTNYIYDHPTALPLYEFTNVKVEQKLSEGKYIYTIYIGGKQVHQVVNTDPRVFRNVKLYASDPWYNEANAKIANLKFDMEAVSLTRANLVKEIKTLSRSWSLSVDIQPHGTVTGWSNVVHATIGGDYLQYGDRVPGIWFHSDTSKLHICSAVNGNSNYIYDHPSALPLNEFTNVKVEQKFTGNNYIYTIYIDGMQVYQVVNTDARVFNEVKLYAADPWYNKANADIRNLEFGNLN